MRHLFAPALIVSAMIAVPAARAQSPQLSTDEDRTLYTLGVLLARNIASLELTPQEVELVKAGVEDGALDKPTAVDVDKFSDNVKRLYDERVAALVQKDKEAGAAYLAKAAAEPGATKTASGIVMKTLTAGTGPSPTATDQVKVHYEGRLVNGKVFDSSIARGEPATFPLNGVIPCWTEAVQLMKVGGKSRIVCPAELAYGERGSPPVIRPGNTLIFDVQLLDIVKPAPGGAQP